MNYSHRKKIEYKNYRFNDLKIKSFKLINKIIISKEYDKIERPYLYEYYSI